MTDAFGLTTEQRGPWKFGGFETLTHEELLRRRERAELLAPMRRQAREEMAARLAAATAEQGRGSELADQVNADVARIRRSLARSRDEQLARYAEAIQSLREAGLEVWLEESPPAFETAEGDGPWTMRATSTARIRWTGDDGSRPTASSPKL